MGSGAAIIRPLPATLVSHMGAVRVLALPFLFQLPADFVPGKAQEDGPSASALSSTKEMQMKLLVPGFSLSWPLCLTVLFK